MKKTILASVLVVKPRVAAAMKRSKVTNVNGTSSSYSTRSKTLSRESNNSEDYTETKSMDLELYKFETKPKLKRQHVKIGTDEHLNIKVKKIVDNRPPKMPTTWEEAVNNLREMRKKHDAPVDSMGCDECADKAAEPKVQRFQSLVSLMMSSQTKDQVNHAAMLRLREHGCTIENIINTSEQKVGELIYPVGFWKTKAKNIKRVAEILKSEHAGDIPKTVEDLMKLPGVGPKMAHLCMKTAWGVVTGIGVDTHVHRISNRLHWVKTKAPEETRKALESWLPEELWSEVNHLLVGFGQQICQPVRPKCGSCLNNKICPFGKKEVGKSKEPKHKK